MYYFTKSYLRYILGGFVFFNMNNCIKQSRFRCAATRTIKFQWYVKQLFSLEVPSESKQISLQISSMWWFGIPRGTDLFSLLSKYGISRSLGQEEKSWKITKILSDFFSQSLPKYFHAQSIGQKEWHSNIQI